MRQNEDRCVSGWGECPYQDSIRGGECQRVVIDELYSSLTSCNVSGDKVLQVSSTLTLAQISPQECCGFRHETGAINQPQYIACWVTWRWLTGKSFKMFGCSKSIRTTGFLSISYKGIKDLSIVEDSSCLRVK